MGIFVCVGLCEAKVQPKWLRGVCWVTIQSHLHRIVLVYTLCPDTITAGTNFLSLKSLTFDS